MSRTKRKSPHWATEENSLKNAEFAKTVIGAPSHWLRPERDAFSHGFDKMGRKTPILNPETREEVCGENNKQEIRNHLTRKVRRAGKVAIREGLKEE